MTITQIILTAYKGFIASFLIFAFLAVATFHRLLPGDDRNRLHRLTRNASVFSRAALRALGISFVINRHPARSDDTGRLIVANHLSWLDIVLLSSVTPVVFITSVELRNAVFLGMLARMAGSLFVERRSPSGLKREIEAVEKLLQDGFSVVLFPEGTTSNGDTVRPFKVSLFDAACRAHVNVLPVCLRYGTVNGQSVTPGNRNRIFYYGGARFFRHLLGVLLLQSVTAEITLLDEIEAARGIPSRKELSSLAHRSISTAYERSGSIQGRTAGGCSA